MRARYAVPLYLLGAVALLYLTFVVGFYAAFHSPQPGYNCHPTITFGYNCTAPDGHTFGGH